MRSRALLILILALAAIACSSGPPTAPPSASVDVGPSGAPASRPAGSVVPAPPTPEPTLASFEPDPAWRPVLELTSAVGGKDQGSFRATGRYRIRYHCLGAGSITVRAGGKVRATLDCAPGTAVPEPVIVKRAGGRHSAEVRRVGQIEWIAVFEVPEG